MKKSLLLGVLLFASQGFAAEYLVKYKSTSALSSLGAMTMSKDAKLMVTDHNPTASLVKVKVDKQNEASTLAQLMSQPGVEYVVPNFKLRAFSEPVTVAALKDQWANTKVQAQKAWQRAGNKGAKNVIVAVIDTGVDYRHESLAPNMMPGYDFRENDADPMDKTSRQNPGHGTHCAGSVAGTGLVDGGIEGLAPGITMMPLRFLGEDGSGDLNNAIKAIDYAVEKGAQIISASWGASVPRSTAAPLLEAIKRADDKGVVFIAAAANDGRNNDRTEVYPANNGLPNSITVAASGPNDTKPSWSNFGKGSVHVSAPGENIISTLPGNKYGNLSGTSMATPLVSGLAALLKSQDPSLTGAQIRAIMQSTGAKVSIETACNCRVDAFNAVDAVLSKKMILVPAATTIQANQAIQTSVMNGVGPFTYTSSNPAIATVDANGVVTGVANGTTTITVTDSKGTTFTSLDYNVGRASGGGGTPPPPDDGGGPGWPDPGNPGEPGECPLGDPMLCQIICSIQPDLPFCQQQQ
ncbi:MAG: S8 family serine peptidase [Bdellovibrionia bacterium]